MPAAAWVPPCADAAASPCANVELPCPLHAHCAAGVVTPPKLIYQLDPKFDPKKAQYLISAALIVSGLTTLVQVRSRLEARPGQHHCQRTLPMHQSSIHAIHALRLLASAWCCLRRGSLRLTVGSTR